PRRPASGGPPDCSSRRGRAVGRPGRRGGDLGYVCPDAASQPGDGPGRCPRGRGRYPIVGRRAGAPGARARRQAAVLPARPRGVVGGLTGGPGDAVRILAAQRHVFEGARAMDLQSLRFTPTHEWVSIEGDVATVGISRFAVDQLTDLILIE